METTEIWNGIQYEREDCSFNEGEKRMAIGFNRAKVCIIEAIAVTGRLGLMMMT